MFEKTEVRLQIISRSEQQESVQTVTADLYDKGGVYYIRYAEPDPGMGRTMTTIRLENGLIRIIRQGDTESELSFAPQSKRYGSYRTPHGSLELETETLTFAVAWTNQGGSAVWSYDLYAGGERSGRFELQLTAEPAYRDV